MILYMIMRRAVAGDAAPFYLLLYTDKAALQPPVENQRAERCQLLHSHLPRRHGAPSMSIWMIFRMILWQLYYSRSLTL